MMTLTFFFLDKTQPVRDSSGRGCVVLELIKGI